MNLKSIEKIKVKIGFVFGSLFLFTIFLYSNCSKVSMYDQQATSMSVVSKTSKSNVPTNVLTPIHLDTIINTSISPTIPIANYFSQPNLKAKWSLDSVQSVSAIQTNMNGVLTILSQDSNGVNYRYDPPPGFRGDDEVSIYIQIESEKMPSEIDLQISVGNPLPLTQSYTMAVRGVGCVMCHAQILGTGSLVTDFGQSNSANLGLLSSNASKKYYGVYSDHMHSFKTSKISNDTNVQVPAAVLSGSPALLSFPSSYTGTINSVNSAITIGAPKVEDLTKYKIDANAVTGLKNVYYYRDNNQSSANLSGLIQDANGVLYNDSKSNLVCEGDLFIDGVVRLTNLKLDSGVGCRIYATGTIFLDGAITYVKTSYIYSHLQLSSSRAIVVGVGNIQSLDSSHDCMTSNSANLEYQYCESTNVLKARLGYFTQANSNACKVTPGATGSTAINSWTADEDMFSTKDDSVNTSQKLLKIVADSDLADSILNSNMKRVDASCDANLANASFSRLLLNAPYIQGRNSNLFSGLIIAENLMWSMNKFQIINDPVFTQVPILPLLDMKTILQVPSN